MPLRSLQTMSLVKPITYPEHLSVESKSLLLHNFLLEPSMYQCTPMQHQQRSARTLFELCPDLVVVVTVSLFALMKVLYIVLKRVLLIQSKLYSFWTGSQGSNWQWKFYWSLIFLKLFLFLFFVVIPCCTHARRDKGPVGGEKATAQPIRAGLQWRIRK
jgi:hypothetical protein